MSSTPSPDQSLHILGAQIGWEPSPIQGVSYKRLRIDKESGGQTALLKFEAGAKFPAHNHPGGEHVYMIEGELHVGKYLLTAGDYLFTPPNGKHAATTETGCMFLVIVPKPIEIIGD